MAFLGTQQTTVQWDSVTIADNASLSGAIHLNGRGLTALIIPATWVTATAITFQASLDDVTYYDMYSDVSGTLTEISVPVAAERYIALDQRLFLGIVYLKIRSGTAASPVNQTEDSGVVIPLVAFPL